MRPINKGSNNYTYRKYQDAQGDLINRIGEHCSYCGRWIASAIHVEHKKPKLVYPELECNWDNFLLSCANCNSNKSTGEIVLEDYVWPDINNTLLAFEYDSEGRVRPKHGLDKSVYDQVVNTWKLLGLNKHVDSFEQGFEEASEKDRRWMHRRQDWKDAKYYKEQLEKADSLMIRELIVTAAKKSIFSVWFTVFQDDTDMRRRLVDAFLGTDACSFNDSYEPICRIGQII
jgi:uncharacterized protein (TIGR02646 family)